MIDNAQFTPRQVTTPNDIQDEKSNIFIRTLFVGTRAIAYEVKCHDKSPNTDGYIELVDEKNHPVGKLTIQAKSYKSKYKGKDKAEIPAYYVAYADRMRNEVCLFFSVDADSQRIYWKYISDDYIQEFKKAGNRTSQTYKFAKDEILSKGNLNLTLDKWKRLFEETLASFSQIKKDSAEIISENRVAFHTINATFNNLPNSLIERREIGQLYNWVKKDLAENVPNIMLLVGNAGTGKSVVIKQLIERLEHDEIKCFAIKADRLHFPQGQPCNEQLEMLTKTFSGLIQEKKAVLIVDQIDALSQYITKDRNKLVNVVTLIKQFTSDDRLRNVRIIVSSRAFDLEFDPKLSELSNAPQIKLGLLDKANVETVLNRLQKGLYQTMDEKTLTLMQTPQHLNLFCRVFVRNKGKQYTSITELYDELWRQTIDMANVDIDKSAAEEILYTLAQKIFDEETLAPRWNPDTKHVKEAIYLRSQGLIEYVNDGTMFFHQSMYDYVFARYYTQNGGSFIDDLLKEKKHQGLFMRSTVNLVLDYERAKNIKQYREDVVTILLSGQIRPHIQLMFLWALANRVDILPFEKRCIRELYSCNKILFCSFIRRTGSKEWYNVIKRIILNVVKDLRVGDAVYDDVLAFMWNHVQSSTEDVYGLVDCIKDKDTRSVVAQRLLYATSDYSLNIVTKWYKVLCDTFEKKVDFLESAMKNNVQFVLDNIAEVFDCIMDSQGIANHIEQSFFENVCTPLKEKCPEALYSILRDRILNAINNHHVHTWREVVGSNSIFPSLMSHHHNTYAIHELFEELLVEGIKQEHACIVADVRLLLCKKESSCYEFAFKAMIEKPLLFSDDIIAILKDSKLVDELLDFGNVEYYFLELIRGWLALVDGSTLSKCQDIIYDFKSASDSLSDKDRKYTVLLYPHWGYNQRKLIWAIPENLRDKRVRKKYQELNRRFGNKWDNTKPNHNVAMAHVCGGLMTLERYRTISIKDWLHSFRGIQSYVNGKDRYFDARTHADAFKQCVSERPQDFAGFVFEMFDDKSIPAIYKLSGLDGLVTGNYPTDQVLPFVWKCIDAFDELSKKSEGYRFCELLNNIVTIDGQHIDRISTFLNTVVLSNYESKYKPDVENVFGSDSAVNDMLTTGINNIQGYAIHTLALIGKHPRWKTKVYEFFVKAGHSLNLEHQLAAMMYLQQECYDNVLYNELMFSYASRPISDYLYLNVDRMHWFWCNNPERILPYFEMIKDKKRAKPILAQIMFLGMQYEKSKNISKVMFDVLLEQNEEEVIKKIVPLAYDHLSDETYREQSEEFLRRYAKDSRKEVRDAYLMGCHRMSEHDIGLFVELLQSWLSTSISDVGIYDIISYMEKCCNTYPYECYQCIKLIVGQESMRTYHNEERVFKMLLSCYRNFMDEEDMEKADEVMDVFDEMMLKPGTMRMDEIIKQVDNYV